MTTDADDVTDELYANPPSEFVARRDALAAQARTAGDKALAAGIKGLRRPSVGAWYLNTASRAGLVSLRELLNLGQELRDAQAGGQIAALRDLAARRGPLVSRVLRDLTAHLAQLGITATPAGLDEVRRTLAAALADPDVAELTGRGRLDKAHDYSGFGPVAEAPTTAPPAQQATPAAAASPPPGGAASRDRIEKERAAAQEELDAVEAEHAGASTAVASAEAELASTRARVDDLLARLAQARDAVTASEAAAAAAAERERVAGDRARQARERLGELSG